MLPEISIAAFAAVNLAFMAIPIVFLYLIWKELRAIREKIR